MPRVEFSINAASELANWDRCHMHAPHRANYRTWNIFLRLLRMPRVEVTIPAASKLANRGAVHMHASLTESTAEFNMFLATL